MRIVSPYFLHQAILRLENGQRDSVTTDVAKRLARALGVRVNDLIGTREDLEEAAATPLLGSPSARAVATGVFRRLRTRQF